MATRRRNDCELSLIAPSAWSPTLRSMLWTNTSMMLPPFTNHVVVDLPVACTFDFNVAGTKYFTTWKRGSAVVLLFSGAVFHDRPRRRRSGGPDTSGKGDGVSLAGRDLEADDGSLLSQ